MTIETAKSLFESNKDRRRQRALQDLYNGVKASASTGESGYSIWINNLEDAEWLKAQAIAGRFRCEIISTDRHLVVVDGWAE